MPSCKASVGSSTPTLLFLDLRTHGGGIKWPRAGAILADHYSLAWRTMDAQHWGVPQRRLRISLVLDLTGGRAGEVLFEPESLRGHFAPGVTPGQATAGTVENGAGTADCTDAIPVNLQIATRHKSLRERTGLGVGRAGDAAYTLQEGHEHGVCCPDIAKAYTLKIRSGCEGGGKGALVQTEKSATLSTLQDQTLFVAEQPKAYSFDSLASNSMKSSNPHSGCREVEIAKTLDTSPPDPAKNQGGIAITGCSAVRYNADYQPAERQQSAFRRPLPPAGCYGASACRCVQNRIRRTGLQYL